MGSVRQLDENHAQVLGHRHEHLAEALDLGFLGAVEMQLVELADAIDEERDIVAEPNPDFLERARRVLDDVVQQRRLNGRRVEPELGQEPRNGDRVSDVGFASLPELAFVKAGAVIVSGVYRVELALAEILGDLRAQARILIDTRDVRPSGLA